MMFVESCEIFGMQDALDVGCLGCWMFGMWNVCGVRCSGFGMFRI